MKKSAVITLTTIATIVLAVPVCLGWVGKAFDVSKTPERINAVEARTVDLEKRMAVMEENQKDIKDSLHRIENALRITNWKSPKDESK